MMFDDLEISDRCYTDRGLAAEATALLLAYLRYPGD